MENPAEYGNPNPQVSAADTEVSVSFGPGTDDIMPVSWASRMLTILRNEQPKRFGDLLTKVLTTEAGKR